MADKVTIVDYGVGNLLSARRAFEHMGAQVIATSSPEGVLAAERLVLPGVGAYGDCVGELARRGLIDPLQRYAATGRPLLGICVGMQMLFEASDEFGETAGLNLLAGRVARLPDCDLDGRPLRVPNIGWAPLEAGAGYGATAAPLIPETLLGRSVYFVHSFAARPRDEADTLAICRFGGHPVVAAVQRGPVMGTQFHPEKSGKVGLSIIRSFIDL